MRVAVTMNETDNYPPNNETHEQLVAYLDGELDDPRDLEDFEKHMEHCRSCFTRAEMEKLLTDRLKEVARLRAPESLHGRLNKLMERF